MTGFSDVLCQAPRARQERPTDAVERSLPQRLLHSSPRRHHFDGMPQRRPDQTRRYRAGVDRGCWHRERHGKTRRTQAVRFQRVERGLIFCYKTNGFPRTEVRQSISARQEYRDPGRDPGNPGLFHNTETRRPTGSPSITATTAIPKKMPRLRLARRRVRSGKAGRRAAVSFPALSRYLSGIGRRALRRSNPGPSVQHLPHPAS